ncbi:shikimate dehydrogenase [Sporosarcina sp. HYO08]|uniref:shikimate dehydrogenase n=1 Tax=Sporosarcina sp. HYO08 TaxID=1759557 RepID=UPI0007922A20|nr:shikimate dehydrogenase [Sporosarcina sp. HYO08]KXH87378.1 shikimate dehydrogenase [Sporosarcina sp. HYO08]
MKKWYAVIGDPIEQSMSPLLHTTWFEETQIDAAYIPVLVKPEKLKDAVESFRTLGCSGWNITAPHKQTIMSYLDQIDESATVMGAVNTVHRLEDGTLTGSNTDSLGFVRSLEEVFGDTGKGTKTLIVGAGGAARGIAYALHAEGYGPLVFTNRTMEKAEKLAADISGSTALSIKDAENRLAEFGLIVQTTSVGMNFAQQGMPIQLKNLAAGTIVSDIIYNPLETEFLKEARQRGAQVLNGVGMFVHQGALSFETWTNTTPNTEKMTEKLTEILEEQHVNN